MSELLEALKNYTDLTDLIKCMHQEFNPYYKVEGSTDWVFLNLVGRFLSIGGVY